MSAPQMKERPASMLRAMFAGFGSLLSVMDKVRSKSAAKSPADTGSPAAAAPSPQTAVPETARAEPETATAPEAVAEPAAPAAAEPVAVAVATEPEVVVAEVVEPEAVVTETVVTETVAAEPESSGGLPLANYDESSVASLRARLRNLSVAQLTQLVEYEKSHAARADVISMFVRRIAKVQAES
jgi:hypothetical protein